MGKSLLIAVLLSLLPVAAQADGSAALRTLDASWNSLRLAADVGALEALLADDWLLTHSDGRVQTKADYLRELSTRSRTNQAIANENVEVRTYGGAAVVTGVSVQAGVSNGQPWSGRFRFTRTWVLQGERWVMVASHSSRVAAAS